MLSDEPLAVLYDRYGVRLYRYAVLLLADPAAAEDVVQEGFCRLARLAPRRQEVVTFAYAITVIRNECYTRLRRRPRAPAAEAPLVDRAASDATEEERQILQQALKALPPEQREVVVLKVFEGMTFQEIAAICEISINTAASRYRYALGALRRELGSTWS